MNQPNNEIRLGVFDINGTIQTSADGIPSTIISGFQNMHDHDIETTVITGRSIAKARELLDNVWPMIVSDGLPVGVENGARLVDEGGNNLLFHEIEPSTIDAVVDATADSDGNVSYLGYSPKNPNAKNVLWLPGQEQPDAYLAANGIHTEMMRGSISQFAARIASDKACMLRVGSNSAQVAEQLDGTNFFVNQGEFNVLAEGIDKGSGVADIANFTGVLLSETLVAGNDFNDLPMLDMDVRKSILVGDGSFLGVESAIAAHKLSSPTELGSFLATV